MLRVYFFDEENPYIREIFDPFEGIVYINMSAHRNGITVLFSEETLIA